jgi:hypothetical protein
MRRYFANPLFLFAVATFVLAIVDRANAVTSTFNREVEVNNIDTNGDTVDDDGNRPFFPDNYNNGTITFTNPDGYTGTATPGVNNSSTVTGVGAALGLGGDGTNALPMGIGVNFDMSFTVQTTGAAGGVLTDSGSNGIGVNSSAQQSDSNTTQLTPNEQLLFSAITLNSSFQDPIGLLAPGATITAKWTALRSNNHGGTTTSDAATTSTDAAVTTDVTTFNTDAAIGNNYSAGLISPSSGGLTGPFYLTTSVGAWSLKGLRYQLTMNYDLAPVPESRRTFMFADSLTSPVYDNLTTHQITASDTTMTINAVGNAAVFDTNDTGVGILSTSDHGRAAAGARRIDGTRHSDYNGDGVVDAGDYVAWRKSDIGGAQGHTHWRSEFGDPFVPEASPFSFDKDVSLESITLGSFNLLGLESMRLSFVSGTNPFATTPTGYSSDYVFDANSVTFTTSGGGQTPYLIPFGVNAQGDIVIEAGTVMSITANPIHTDGGFLLDMITVNLLPEAGNGVGSAAVPEPRSFAWSLLGSLAFVLRWRREA